MRKYFALLAVAALALGSTSLQAAPIVWELDYVYTGPGIPSGPVIVSLETTALNTVLLTVDATALTGEFEFVSNLYLNLDDDLSRVGMSDTWVDTGDVWDYTSVGYEMNEYMAPGDGKFDILVSFADSGDDRLDAGETAQIEFTYTPADSEELVQESFELLSDPAGGSGPFYVVAHVQGIGDDGQLSGHVTTNGNGEVPEASTLMLFGSGLSGLLFYVKKKGLIKL